MVTEGEHGGFLERRTPRPMAFLLQITMFGCEFFQAVIGSSSMEKRRVLEFSTVFSKKQFPYFWTHPDVNSENLQVAQSKMNCGFVSWHRERM